MSYADKLADLPKEVRDYATLAMSKAWAPGSLRVPKGWAFVSREKKGEFQYETVELVLIGPDGRRCKLIEPTEFAISQKQKRHPTRATVVPLPTSAVPGRWTATYGTPAAGRTWARTY